MLVKILYLCDVQNVPTDKRNKIIFGTVEMEDVEQYYKCVYEYEIDKVDNVGLFLEEIFEQFNVRAYPDGDSDNDIDLNPLCDAKYQKLIKEYKTHTSMSIGDIICLDDDYYVVQPMGFNKMEKIE